MRILRQSPGTPSSRRSRIDGRKIHSILLLRMMNGGESKDRERPLIDWVLAMHPETPKSRAKQWILAGRVSVNGQIIRKPQLVLQNPGSALKFLERRFVTLDCGKGWEIHPRVSLLHLDSALAVIDKGAGLVSVPSPNAALSALSILQDFLAGRLRARNRDVAGRSVPPTFRRLELLPVHRIDQYTTGVFCLACNPAARQKLIEQLRARSMHREYVAFVEGRPAVAEGTWRHLLSLSDDELRQQLASDLSTSAGAGKTQEAITHYTVLSEFPVGDRFVTKLSLRLETGLRHQIRVQAAEAGLPLIGDRRYHPDYSLAATVHPVIPFTRQALHAASLTLEHPEQVGQRITWRAELPKDLRELEHILRSLRSKSHPAIPRTE